MTRKAKTYTWSVVTVRTLIWFSVLIPLCANAQFYRGSYQTFGKNRIQYKEKNWEHIDFTKFNVYFYDAGKNLGHYTAKTANESLKELEKKFDYRLRGKTYILVFNNMQEYLSSNIGLETGEDQNIGGTLNVQGNKIFVYFNGDHSDLDRQLKEGLARLLMYQMGYGEDWKEVIKNSALLTFPDWYSEGVVSYASRDWAPEVESKVRDLVMRGDFKHFNRLDEQNAKAAGHAIWNYIDQVYGADVIPNIIYMTKVSRNVENGFLFVLGVSMDRLFKEAENYYSSRFTFDDDMLTLPKQDPLPIRSKRRRIYQKPVTDQSGNKLAYATNQAGQHKVYVYDVERGRRKRLLKRGHKLDREAEMIYPLLKWHPTEDILAIVYRRGSEITLELHNFEDKDRERIELRRLDKVLDFNFSPDGSSMIFSAISEGRTDLFEYKMLTRSQSRVTNDPYDYLNPSYMPDSSRIIFSSNRPDENINLREKVEYKAGKTEFQNKYDVFVLDYKSDKKGKITRVTDNPDSDELQPFGLDDNRYTYLSGRSGIVNRYTAHIDSTISHIDTTVHYRYFTVEEPVTRYKRSIEGHYVNRQTNQVTDLIKVAGDYRFYISDINEMKVMRSAEEIETSDAVPGGSDRKTAKSDRITVDDVEVVGESEEEEDAINIDHYEFEDDIAKEEEEEDEPVENSRFIELREQKEEEAADEKKFKMPKQEIYRRAFLMGEQTIQLDWNFANNIYQRFNGGPWVAPGMGMVAKTDIIELMEDYVFEGGVRYALNGNSTEFFARFINRKKRLNKEFMFQRQSLTQEPTVASLLNTHIYKGSYILTYPFSEVSAIRATPSYRFDQNITKATDFNTLNTEDTYNHWGGFKLEYIFDNTRDLDLNLYQGTRMKLFGEYYNELNVSQSDFFVLGLDFRKYIKIHRNLIWANRFAQSTSFGYRRLVYYMGGTDNWIRAGNEQFNHDTEIARDQGYFFQTIATPMRGFLQNARNGNSFALLNSEIRWPVFEYFSRKPIKSEFLRHFQIIAFGDVGTAWTGVNPYSDENSFNTQTIRHGGSSVAVVLQNQIDPVIGGFGMGLRAKIFGYFIRFDYARGVEDGIIQDRSLYFSLGLDF